LYKGYNICAGDIIYLEKKNSKAAKKYKFHTTKEGESLYLIAQKYGIRLKKLYKMNPQYENYSKLKVGDVIRLR
jgi:LysM repeat protein